MPSFSRLLISWSSMHLLHTVVITTTLRVTKSFAPLGNVHWFSLQTQQLWQSSPGRCSSLCRLMAGFYCTKANLHSELATDVTGYVALDHTNRLVVVSFRGSYSLDSWINNLKLDLTKTVSHLSTLLLQLFRCPRDLKKST